MFTTLQSRLWLTYILLVGVVLTIIFIGLVVYLVRSPFTDRQALLRLQLLNSEIVSEREKFAGDLDDSRLQDLVTRIDPAFDVRVLGLGRDGSLLADSRRSTQSNLGFTSRLLRQSDGIVRDLNRKPWLFSSSRLPNGVYLITAAPRPARTALLSYVFGDSLMGLFAQAGIAALILSLVMAFGIVRWVSTPLKNIAAAARQVSEGSQWNRMPPSIPEEGPEEVKSLASTFNRMTRQVYTSQQSQRDFVANISHELKTPLTSIQGFSQAIFDGTVSDPSVIQRSAQIIYDESSRMHRMVMELLDLARFDAGTIELKMGGVNLVELLDYVCERMRPQAESRNVSLVLVSEDIPEVTGDGDRLVQVFTNLIENAIKFSLDGGSVDIRVRNIDGWVEIAFQDNGKGMLPEQMERIFERFYQLDESRNRGDRGGVGLGLAIVKEIVQAHLGTITVESQPAQGSTFMVKLPVTRNELIFKNSVY